MEQHETSQYAIPAIQDWIRRVAMRVRRFQPLPGHASRAEGSDIKFQPWTRGAAVSLTSDPRRTMFG